MRGRKFRILGLLAIGVVGACGGETGPNGNVTLNIVGDGGADSVRTPRTGQISVTVRRGSDPAERVEVHFRVIPQWIGLYTWVRRVSLLAPGPAFVWEMIAKTNTDGVIGVVLRMDVNAGPAEVEVSVPAHGLVDTLRYTVLPGNAVATRMTSPDTAVYVGGRALVRGGNVDAWDNIRPDPVTFSSSSNGITVGADGSVAGVAIGVSAVEVAGTFGVDTAFVSIVPVGTIGIHYVGYMHPSTGDLTFVGLAVIDLDGSDFQWLGAVAGNFVSSLFPVWNPAGTRLTFSDRFGTIRLWTSDMNDPLNWARAIPDAGPFMRVERFPAFSSDGQWLYFSGTETGLNEALWRVKADGTSPERLSPGPGINGPAPPYARASPSPDGTTLAFVKADLNTPPGIRIFDVATGTESSWIVPGQGPKWSPTGSTIAFVESGGGAIKLMDTDGTNVRTLTTTGYIYGEMAINWSPDGKWIVGESDQGMDVIDATTGLTLPLGWPPTRFHQPTWQP